MTATTTGTEASAAGEDAGNPATSAAGPVLAGAHSHGPGSAIPGQSRAERLASC